MIVKLSSGLMKVTTHGSTDQVQFIHQDVRDYLLRGGMQLLRSTGRAKERCYRLE